MRQGTVLTALLWIASVAAHLGYDKLAGGTAAGDVGAATMLLYFAVQRRVLLTRAARFSRVRADHARDIEAVPSGHGGKG